jgi:hypothetical protein
MKITEVELSTGWKPVALRKGIKSLLAGLRRGNPRGCPGQKGQGQALPLQRIEMMAKFAELQAQMTALWSAKTLFLLAGTGSYQQNLTILHSIKNEGKT